MVNAAPAATATAAAAKQPSGPATVVPSKSKRTKDPEDDLGLFSPVPTRLGDLTMFTPPNSRSIQAAENAAAGVAALAALEEAKHQKAGHARDPAMALPSLSELVTQTSPNVKAAAPLASSNTSSASAPQAAAAVDKNENILVCTITCCRWWLLITDCIIFEYVSALAGSYFVWYSIVFAVEPQGSAHSTRCIVQHNCQCVNSWF